VVLLLDKPDDRALDLILGRQIDGFATTYASTHDEVAARASHLPAVMSYKGLAVREKYVYSAGLGATVKEGEVVVLDGDAGRLITSAGKDVLIKRGVEIFSPHGLDGLQIYREVRQRFQSASYEELLQAHADNVREASKLDDKVAEARLELETHFIHLLIFERAEKSGRPINQVYLDVATYDGNLSRVPGLERTDFVIFRESDGQVNLVFETSVEYLGEEIEAHAVPDIEDFASFINQRSAEAGLSARQVTRMKKLSAHTNWINTSGFIMPPAELERFLELIREYLTQTPDIKE
jgi:hypothetical protein